MDENIETITQFGDKKFKSLEAYNLKVELLKVITPRRLTKFYTLYDMVKKPPIDREI